MWDACVIGHITLDTNRSGGSILNEAAGGVVVYAGSVYCSLGLSTKIMTRAAKRDIDGLAGPLRKQGVEVECFDCPETTVFENRYSGLYLEQRDQVVKALASPFEFEMLRGLKAAILQLGPLTSQEMSLGFIEAAAACGDMTVLDAQGLLRKVEEDRIRPISCPDLKGLLPLIDILKVDAEEASLLTGEEVPEKAARLLVDLGAREAVISLGAAGSLIRSSDRCEVVQAVAPRNRMDPTGCGDSFAAAYAYARRQGLTLREAGHFAAALAALVLESKGPFAGSIEDVWRRLPH